MAAHAAEGAARCVAAVPVFPPLEVLQQTCHVFGFTVFVGSPQDADVVVPHVPDGEVSVAVYVGAPMWLPRGYPSV